MIDPRLKDSLKNTDPEEFTNEVMKVIRGKTNNDIFFLFIVTPHGTNWFSKGIDVKKNIGLLDKCWKYVTRKYGGKK